MLKHISLNVKMAGLALFVGLLLWSVVDHIQSKRFKEIFQDQIIPQLNQRGDENVRNFSALISSYSEIRIITLTRNFVDYIEEKDQQSWMFPMKKVVYHSDIPPWLQPIAVFRHIPYFQFAILMDKKQNVREVFHRGTEEFPQFVSQPSRRLLLLSNGQSYLTTIEGVPYLFRSKEIFDNVGSLQAVLLLATPIDSDFLVTSQKEEYFNNFIALIAGEDSQVVVSNQPKLLPTGSLISSFEDKYLLLGQHISEYGSSELQMSLVSFMSRKEYEDITHSVLYRERVSRTIGVGVLVLFFLCIIFYISRRVRLLTGRVVEFSTKNLGAQPSEILSGDEFFILEDQFQSLAVDVENSQRVMEEYARELTEAKEVSETILNSMQDAICLIDVRDYGIIDANDSFWKLYGEKEQVVGKTCHAITHGQEQPCDVVNELCPIKDTLASSGLATCEHLHVLPDGREQFMEISTYPIFNKENQADRVVHVSRDISVRKQIEFERQESEKKAEEASLAKSQFLANMSHEIRTPMNAILGMTRLALDTDLSSEQDKYLQTVMESGESLLHLLNDILDFSKIEAGQIALGEKPFNLQYLLESVVTSFSPGAREKLINLSYDVAGDCCLDLFGDSNRLRQILTNLLSNALKFTVSGEVSLLVQALKQDEKRLFLKFSISDTGPGIPAEYKNDIFDRFTQVDSKTTRIHEGSGLGLAICKHLVKLFGGTIWVEDGVKGGSVFHFTVWVHEDENPVPSHKKVSADNKNGEHVVEKSLRVLVVEDNVFNQDLVNFVLQKSGHVVTLASTGVESLEFLSKEQFDIILMDIQMPEMDGLTATRYIRASEKGDLVEFGDQALQDLLSNLRETIIDTHVPIIAMTAHAMSGDRELCLDAGMDEYLTKPLQPEELGEVLLRLGGENHSENSSLVSTVNAEITGTSSREFQLKKLSLEAVRKYLGEKYQLSSEIIDNMLVSLGDSLTEELESAYTFLSKGDFSELSKVAHSMKGALRNAGINSWADVAFRIEKQRVRDDEELRSGLEALLEEMKFGLSPLLDRTLNNKAADDEK